MGKQKARSPTPPAELPFTLSFRSPTPLVALTSAGSTPQPAAPTLQPSSLQLVWLLTTPMPHTGPFPQFPPAFLLGPHGWPRLFALRRLVPLRNWWNRQLPVVNQTPAELWRRWTAALARQPAQTRPPPPPPQGTAAAHARQAALVRAYDDGSALHAPVLAWENSSVYRAVRRGNAVDAFVDLSWAGRGADLADELSAVQQPRQEFEEEFRARCRAQLAEVRRAHPQWTDAASLTDALSKGRWSAAEGYDATAEVCPNSESRKRC